MANLVNQNLIAKLQEKQSALSEKIDTLYDVESLIEKMQSYLYRENVIYNENGDYMRDENDNIMYEKTDCRFNTLIDEVIDYLMKKYC